MSTAGRAIVFSGLAVAAGLALLLFMPVPFIRAMGVAGLLIPLVSIAAALTLQPALLSLFGSGVGCGSRRACALTVVPVDAFGQVGRAPRLASSRSRPPRSWLAAVPALSLRLTPGSISGIPHSLEAVRGFDLLSDRVAAGAVTPTEIVIDTGAPSRKRRAGRARRAGSPTCSSTTER